jgi:hypothetical protein
MRSEERKRTVLTDTGLWVGQDTTRSATEGVGHVTRA